MVACIATVCGRVTVCGKVTGLHGETVHTGEI